jgi:hypothetical protein
MSDSVNCVSFSREPAHAELSLMVTPFLATSSHGVGDLHASMTTLVEGNPLMPALVWSVRPPPPPCLSLSLVLCACRRRCVRVRACVRM